MKIYKTQSEVEADIKDEVLVVQGDVKFECSISIGASIKVVAGDINAGDIDAWDIDAGDINAWNIDAGDINARDINAWNIDAGDINAWNIDAGDINARDINAGDILYHAFCSAYNSIKCLSIKAKREVHSKLVCLNGSLEIKKPEETENTGKKQELIDKANELKEKADELLEKANQL